MMVTQMLHRSLAPLTGGRRFDMDMPLLVGGIALLSLGLVMVSSASMEVAAGQLGSPLYYMKRQLVYMFIGVLALLGTLAVPLRFWEQSRFLLLVLAFVLLIAVLIPRSEERRVGKECRSRGCRQ